MICAALLGLGGGCDSSPVPWVCWNDVWLNEVWLHDWLDDGVSNGDIRSEHHNGRLRAAYDDPGRFDGNDWTCNFVGDDDTGSRHDQPAALHTSVDRRAGSLLGVGPAVLFNHRSVQVARPVQWKRKRRIGQFLPESAPLLLARKLVLLLSGEAQCDPRKSSQLWC